MPHEKIYHGKSTWDNPRSELWVTWGQEPYVDNVFTTIYLGGTPLGTVALEEQDVEDLIKYLRKAQKKTWPRGLLTPE